MTNYEINDVRETFSRLFVIAVMSKMNFNSFTSMLSKSDFINQIEQKKYNNIFNKPLNTLFFEITGFKVGIDNSFGIYNDAYWSGQNYFDLHTKTNKSFAYIFLKLPFKQMMNIYTIFHEMDFSSLVEYFNKKCEEKTILRLLCDETNKSINDVNKATNISINTLKKYMKSDIYLYNASFQNIVKIISFFEVSHYLFVES